MFYEKIEEAAAPDGYTMGHSSQMFLFGPDAGYVTSWQAGDVNETLIRELVSAEFLDLQRNLVLVGGTGTGKTHLAVRIARACIR